MSEMRRNSRVLLGGSLVALALLSLTFSPIVGAFEPELYTTDFFAERAISDVQLSPTGDLVAMVMPQGKRVVIRMVDMERAIAVDIDPLPGFPRFEVGRVLWADDDSLVVEYEGVEHLRDIPHLERQRRGLRVIHVRRKPGEAPDYRLSVIAAKGELVSAAPGRADLILFADGSIRRGAVHELRLARFDDLPEPTDDALRPHANYPEFSEDTVHVETKDEVLKWLADGNGDLRVALTLDRNDLVRLKWRPRGGGRWKTIESWRPNQTVDFHPIAVDDANDTILVMSNRDRDNWGLFSFDVSARRLGPLMVEPPGDDIRNPLFDASGSRVIGVVYLRDGRFRPLYFDERGDRQKEWAERFFPAKDAWVKQSVANGSRALFRSEASDDPGTWYWADFKAKRIVRVGSIYPDLVPEKLAPVQRFTVESKDGLEIEGFLTRPRVSDGLPPLVVMPHGGPIGVVDHGGFNPEVQQIAAAGIAVLQVNFRGSKGKGREFLEAGYRQWGRGIEDDIDLLMDHVIERGLVDGQRICIAGASYGGYSALMSVIRHPDRFACAASFAGVTDIALRFSSANFAMSRSDREYYMKWVGDPAADYEEMKRYSPVYHVDRIKVPLQISHGTADTTVTIEHSRRLLRMLDLHRVPYEWYEYVGVGHGFPDRRQAAVRAARLRLFLVDHLFPEGD